MSNLDARSFANTLVSFCLLCILDCSQFYVHGPLQESLVLVRPCRSPGRLLEEGSSKRSVLLASLMWSSYREEMTVWGFFALLQGAFVETHFQLRLSRPTADCGLNSGAAAAGWAKDFQLFMKVQCSVFPCMSFWYRCEFGHMKASLWL